MENDEQNKIAYLQMIQNTIDRMSEKESIFKGFAITADVLLIDLLIKNNNIWLLFISIFIIIFLWYHSAYFLHLERLYRIKYNKICDTDIVDFNMKPELLDNKTEIKIKNSFCSFSLFWFYFPIIIINSLIFFIFLIGGIYGS